jgi:hypothetical protein
MMMTPSFAREMATLTLFPRKRSQPLCRTVAVGVVDNDNSGRVTLSRVVAEDARVVLQTQQRLLGCLALLFDLSVLILDDLTPVVPGRAVRTDDRNLLVHLVAEDSMQKNTATSRTTEDMVVLNLRRLPSGSRYMKWSELSFVVSASEPAMRQRALQSLELSSKSLPSYHLSPMKCR